MDNKRSVFALYSHSISDNNCNDTKTKRSRSQVGSGGVICISISIRLLFCRRGAKRRGPSVSESIVL